MLKNLNRLSISNLPFQQQNIRSCVKCLVINQENSQVSQRRVVSNTYLDSSFLRVHNHSSLLFKQRYSQLNDKEIDLFDLNEFEFDDGYQSHRPKRPPLQQSFQDQSDDLHMRLSQVQADHSNAEFQKDFYEESPETNSRSQDALDDYYSENAIKVFGKQVPKPVLSFEELNISSQFIQRLEKNGFDKPTPIQAVTWPVTLSGRNIIGIAQTGSGKTLSFLLPAIIHISSQERPKGRQGPIALVLCPTRELAKQCKDVADKFFSRNARTTCLFGGGEKSRQIEDLSRGCDLVIATPGRLRDLLASRELSLIRCTFLVLDEADRMLDMGFEPQIRQIIDLIRPDRQITMWSATWPEEVKTLASRYLSDQDPVHIQIGAAELTPNSDVEQKFVLSSSNKKVSRFMDTLKNVVEEFETSNNNTSPKILVFCNQKRSCEYVSKLIIKGGLKSMTLHGNISQTSRDYALNGFRKSYFPVLVATDVAARGLDVSDIDFVINFDAPLNSVSYIHRIGRTGRAGRKGTSITFLTEEDGGILSDIIDSLRAVGKPVNQKLIEMEEWWKRKKREAKRTKNSSFNRYSSNRWSSF